MNDNKKVGAVILSRFNSRRLPGKALIEIQGKPVLDYIIERLEQVLSTQDIVIATSAEKSDDPIAEFADKRSIKCFRGPLENVAGRFFEAGNSQNWDYAIRVNGDNIFADINLMKSMINRAKNENLDFISNVKHRTYPKGMSIEIVNLEWYKNLLNEIEKDKNYREHVTLYIYENNPRGDYHFQMNDELPEAAGIQLALDTPEDLARTRRIISTFDLPHYTYNLKEIMDIYGEE